MNTSLCFGFPLTHKIHNKDLSERSIKWSLNAFENQFKDSIKDYKDVKEISVAYADSGIRAVQGVGLQSLYSWNR